MTPVCYRSDVEQVIPPQSVFNEARRRFMDEWLAFNPIHAIEAH